MKLFSNYIIIFNIIFIVLYLVVFKLTSLFTYKIIDLKSDSNKSFVVIGHSHSEFAYNDDLIENLVNIAKSKEPYLYLYLKLQKFLEQNNNINTVFVEFTNNNISALMDDWMFDSSDIKHKYVRYASFMSFEDYSVIFKGNPTEFIHRFPDVLRRNFSFMFNSGKNFLNEFGGHIMIDNKLELKHLVIKDSIGSTKQYQPTGVSEINIHYLKKIINLCKQRQVKVVLIRSPFHSLYLLNKNQELYLSYLKDDFKALEYLDFSGFTLRLDELADTQHLNKYGAERYSNWFNNFLKLGIFKQSTVDSLIAIENSRFFSKNASPIQ